MANKINPNEISRELLAKAQACETAGELMKLAKENGMELTKEEAEAYMAEFSSVELDDEMLKKVAGGDCYNEDTCVYCPRKDCPGYGI